MPSFDIESTFNSQEVANAVDQASRELITRYDFKNTNTHISFKEPEINVTSSTEERLNAAIQVLIEKLIKRKQSSKILSEYKDSKGSKEEIKRTYYLSSGIAQEDAKRITKEIKSYNKKIQTTIQGPVVRVAGKKKDELQEIMLLVKEMNNEFPVSFTNFKD